MKKTSEPIVFFGSGPVAAKSLRLLAQDFVIEAVITKPRPEHHKGEVPVITLAEKLGLDVKTASDKKELDALFATNPVQSDLAVLVDFGIIVSKQVIDYFPLGIINSHFSLLPQWRGADPISFSILSGQTVTGVSLMMLVPAMDEGPLLATGALPVSPRATTPSLTNELIILSNNLLQEAIPAYLAGKMQPEPQSDKVAPSYSKKLTKDDGLIDWNKSAEQIEREIRAYFDWPKSRTTFSSLDVVVTASHVVDLSGKPGSVDIRDKQPLIYCGSKALAIDELKPAGKQKMTGQAFLAGYKKIFLSGS